MSSSLRRRARSAGAGLLLLLAACFPDRARPEPFSPTSARLSVQLLEPRHGLTVRTGADVTVSVLARDLDGRALTGVGFVARRVATGFPTLDSVAVFFTPRADSTHEFTLRVPVALPNNAQVDIYGIAFGPVGMTRVSTPASLVAVCQNACQ